MFDRIARFILRARWALLLLLAIVTGLLVVPASSIRFDFSPRSIFLTADEEVRFLDSHREVFGEEDGIVMVLLEAEDVFAPEVLQTIVDLSDEMGNIEGIESVLSLSTVPQLRGAPPLVEVSPLLDEVPSWPHAFDVVVGNPPFLGQLRSSTARSRSRAKSLRSRFGELAQGYVDESALFLARGAELLSPRGRLGLIVPSSLLGAASAEPVRQRLTRQSHLSAIWVGGSDVFADASVDVVAPILTRAAGASGEVRITDCQGGTFLASDPGDRWADAVASASGVPRVSLTGAPLGEMARVTADFRDAYYWIAERVSEQHETPDAPRLATVGLVDPLHFRHGHSSVRFAKRRYDAPVVPDASGGARYLTWRSKRLRPKLLVATQTKVLECVVDASGDVLPSTPLLVIEPTDASDVWRVAAALTSPALSAWAARQGSGTGLGQGTFRLRASQLADAPLPTDASAWDEGAQLARQLHSDGGEAPSMDGLYELGRIMNRAYAEADPDALLDWWMSRLPHRGRASA